MFKPVNLDVNYILNNGNHTVSSVGRSQIDNMHFKHINTTYMNV